MFIDDRLIRAKRPNPLRAIISVGAAVLAGLMFLGSSDWMMQAMSWVALSLSLLLAIRLVFRTVFAPDLVLTPEGFQVRGVSFLIRWSEVARFGQADLRRASFVIYSLKTRPYGSGQRPIRLRGLPVEADGYLAQTDEMGVAEQLALLNEWKSRYGG